LANWLTSTSSAIFKSSISQLINVVLTFYILYFLLRDRTRAKAALIEYSPLSPNETEDLVVRFVETIHATVFGTAIMAVVQGTLGGLMFWWLGLPLPLLWGTIMAVLAIVPVLGAFVIWIPAAIYLALEGRWTSALILAGWGGGVVASIDNILYPTLVGNRLKLHTLLALVASFGGLIVFGASGLILGPAVITVTISLLGILKKRLSSTPL
jgi:predicted PurR-regulated permease PerM